MPGVCPLIISEAEAKYMLLIKCYENSGLWGHEWKNPFINPESINVAHNSIKTAGSFWKKPKDNLNERESHTLIESITKTARKLTSKFRALKSGTKIHKRAVLVGDNNSLSTLYAKQPRI